ncbi:hypothetical protein ACH4A8_40600 [Streptomyces vietnamensis]|uniref:hypothetical protein n=1 Tax=Streptomyces vietnamensis TaxID=362257 RepID=UPI0037B449CE
MALNKSPRRPWTVMTMVAAKMYAVVTHAMWFDHECGKSEPETGRSAALRVPYVEAVMAAGGTTGSAVGPEATGPSAVGSLHSALTDRFRMS